MRTSRRVSWIEKVAQISRESSFFFRCLNRQATHCSAMFPFPHAVLSVPNSSRPVVLNFVRSGEDGKPTLYITDDRPRGAELKTQRRLESPGAAKTEARCLSVRNCGGGEDGCSESDVSGLSVLGEGANQGEGGVCSSFGCPTSTRGVAPATARLGAVDIQMRPVLLNSVSPAPPVYSLPVSDSESVGCGWQGIACCAAPAVRAPALRSVVVEEKDLLALCRREALKSMESACLLSSACRGALQLPWLRRLAE